MVERRSNEPFVDFKYSLGLHGSPQRVEHEVLVQQWVQQLHSRTILPHVLTEIASQGWDTSQRPPRSVNWFSCIRRKRKRGRLAKTLGEPESKFSDNTSVSTLLQPEKSEASAPLKLLERKFKDVAAPNDPSSEGNVPRN
mmetsp:Transcript_4258/g.9573  ORF Transcript_4258/g.9573 Transcript_4258/m.9573 type:complete len:140 (+) Transcript_4258:239-658(+)